MCSIHPVWSKIYATRTKPTVCQIEILCRAVINGVRRAVVQCHCAVLSKTHLVDVRATEQLITGICFLEGEVERAVRQMAYTRYTYYVEIFPYSKTISTHCHHRSVQNQYMSGYEKHKQFCVKERQPLLSPLPVRNHRHPYKRVVKSHRRFGLWSKQNNFSLQQKSEPSISFVISVEITFITIYKQKASHSSDQVRPPNTSHARVGAGMSVSRLYFVYCLPYSYHAFSFIPYFNPRKYIK